jgi:uncharacterized protein
MSSSDSKYTRREFIVKPVAYLATAGLVGASADLLDGQILKSADSTPAPKLITRPLGKTGISLPIVSMGVMNTDAPGIIVRAYEVGIRHFDTAAVYLGGRSEEVIGQIVRKLGVRDNVVISTKERIRSAGSGNPAETKAEMLRAFDASLKRLQMDHVDILYLHGVETVPPLSDAGVLEAMAQLKKEGKIRCAGVSTHRGQAEVLNALARSDFWDVAVVAFNYTMSDNQPLLDAMKVCASKGIGLIAMKSQAGGLKPVRNEVLGSDSPPSVRQSAVLKWVLQHPFVTTAIPGFTNFEQIDQDIPVASNLAFTNEERKFISDNEIKASLEFCQQCGQCQESCPDRVNIPTLMRSHMYAFQYANLEQARFALAEVPASKGLNVCRSCAACVAICSHTVNIGRKVQDLKSFAEARLVNC